MTLSFVTGNTGKFSEFEALLGAPLTQVVYDLPELQSLDPLVVLRAKAEAALPHIPAPFIVEDSSLTLGCLQGKLPGPFIKWFEEGLQNEGIVVLVQKMGDATAIVSTYVAYVAEDHTITFFEGHVEGEIVPSRGTKDFGYGPIFQPKGSTLTYGEMEREEKHRLSSRAITCRKLREFLNQS